MPKEPLAVDSPPEELGLAPLSRPADPEPPAPEDDLPVTFIAPRRGWRLINLAELWHYRELLYFLAWRDIKVRYKQAVLGAAWAILQPLAMMLVFSLFVRRAEQQIPGNLPYPIFLFSGLLPWIFFANVITASSASVVGSQNLVRKVYFPRLLIPMGAAGAGLVDFLVAFGVLLILMFASGIYPGLSMLLVPLLVLGLLMAALGFGTLLAALTVAYRDFRYLVPFSVQLWMFGTPAIYMGTTELNTTCQAILPLNPAYGLIANFRAAALNQPLDLRSLAISAGVGFLCLVVGCFYFRRVERSFADIV
jgi:lipopolysaccharide transport system permease protein